jgi:hypothetical protein
LPCVGAVSGKTLDDHVSANGHPIERFSLIRDRVELIIRERMHGLETRPFGTVIIHSHDI